MAILSEVFHREKRGKAMGGIVACVYAGLSAGPILAGVMIKAEKINKPYLILQLDEHSSVVGYMTRIEAAVDTFVNDFKLRKGPKGPVSIQRRVYVPDTLSPGDTVLIPMTDRRINRLQKALFEVSGFDAQWFPWTGRS